MERRRRLLGLIYSPCREIEDTTIKWPMEHGREGAEKEKEDDVQYRSRVI